MEYPSLTGYLRELAHAPTHPVSYRWCTDTGTVALADVLGQPVRLTFTGQKACIHCGRRVRKLYNNGYCYPCLTTLAECDLCIVKPHTCHFDQGTCRDETFARSHCFTPHVVYLAWSSEWKVGITRKGREFKRWIDQGASAAVVIAELADRRTAGELEVAMSAFLPDKTNWRHMLRTAGPSKPPQGMSEFSRTALLPMVPTPLHTYVRQDPWDMYHFAYPSLPGAGENLTPLSFDRQPCISGVLLGMKGQYLILDCGVLHVKKHAGYHVHFTVAQTPAG
ncbi:MAG: DUF2797 domain-containing protein [Alicyclobacillus sp.]|nr:DUF2797 domain-containing protein [Alicyclobacillus sp.]